MRFLPTTLGAVVLGGSLIVAAPAALAAEQAGDACAKAGAAPNERRPAHSSPGTTARPTPHGVPHRKPAEKQRRADAGAGRPSTTQRARPDTRQKRRDAAPSHPRHACRDHAPRDTTVSGREVDAGPGPNTTGGLWDSDASLGALGLLAGGLGCAWLVYLVFHRRGGDGPPDWPGI